MARLKTFGTSPTTRAYWPIPRVLLLRGPNMVGGASQASERDGKDKPVSESAKFWGSVVVALIFGLVVGFAVYCFQKDIERTRIREELQDKRMNSFRSEFRDFNQQAGKTILATYELAAAVEDYINGKEADKAQLKKAFDTARNKHIELPNFIGSCKSLRTYLRTKESLDALEKLEKAFGDLFASSTREAANGAIEALNIHWDDFMKTMDAEFAYKD